MSESMPMQPHDDPERVNIGEKPEDLPKDPHDPEPSRQGAPETNPADVPPRESGAYDPEPGTVLGGTRVENPVDEYDTMEVLFMVEGLSDHMDEFAQQMKNLRRFILAYNKANENHANDDTDDGTYVDEAIENVESAIKNFTINGKSLDIRTLCKSGTYEDMYNDIAIEANAYIEDKNKQGKRSEYFDKM